MILSFPVLSILSPVCEAADDEEPRISAELTQDTRFLEIERERAEVRLKKERNKLFLSRVMPFVGMGFTIVILSIIFGFVRKSDKTRHETIRKYLEKGEKVPRELLVDSGDPATWKPVSDRRKGIIWCAVGLGIAITFLIFAGGNAKAGAVGIIPLFIGFGYFIAALIDPKSTDEEEA